MRNAVATLLLTVLLPATPALGQASQRYADHSRLAQGTWVKIRVPATGVYQLTDQMLRQAGFADPSAVRVFGYGGALQPEVLTADYLAQTDDLQEVTQCVVGGRRLFHATGPVSWASASATTRTRNPYSDYGYYFLTADGTPPTVLDSATFVQTFHPSADDYHALYEVDDYAWYSGGRNLYDRRLFGTGVSRSYTLPAYSTSGTLTVVMSYNGYIDATVEVNGMAVGNITINAATLKSPERRNGLDQYSKAAADTWVFQLRDMLSSENTVTITQQSGQHMRLDYIALTSNAPRPAPRLSAADLPVPEVVGTVAHQDLHADQQADMVIVIPTSRFPEAEAERLARLHRNQDGLSVRIVAADELYNEFSSGTPDANAYRRYLKMLYDRADERQPHTAFPSTTTTHPRFLLLMGDAAWDNRMVLDDWSQYSPDDFLLCYESDNSYSQTECYTTDDYFALLDDDEGKDIVKTDMADMAVGRLTPRNAAQAHILVDKIISYHQNEEAGDWQNTICFMADDGNKNMHMEAADTIARLVTRLQPGLLLRKVYWDAYQRTATATGYAYPDVERLVQQQMQEGALVMNYTGHGGSANISHEVVASMASFAVPTSLRLPLWFTASCDIMPFDTQYNNIGETAMLNTMGGAIAFYGTTRTVYADYNRTMNEAFMRNLLTEHDGRRVTIGEAVRITKNELMELMLRTGRDMKKNCLHFNLLGDPALTLAMPTLHTVVDRINGRPTDAAPLALPAGTAVTIEGHVEGATTFNGTATLTVRDATQHITCRVNNTDTDDKPRLPFEYDDRPETIYHGTMQVSRGQFSHTFTIPLDVSYADATSLLTTYALSADHTLAGSGSNTGFSVVSADHYALDGEGPAISATLDGAPLVDGMHVAQTPYLYAVLTDPDGVNVSGLGVGHDLELVIDGRAITTFSLNSYFAYDVDNYRRGTVGYYLPMLSDGQHHVLLRAWDALNNSSTVSATILVNVEQQAAGIGNVTTQPDTDALYDAAGRRLPASAATRDGLYLRRDSRGDTRKIVITH